MPRQSDSEATTQFVEADNVRYAYRRFGERYGVPLLFLQHYTGTMNNWDPVLTNGIGRARPVILFDNAGVGQSGGKTPTTVTEMARAVISFVRALGLEQVDLFGFSIGGFVAQQVCALEPALVRRAILAGTGPAGGERMTSFSPKVQEAFLLPTPAERLRALFFAPTPTSQAAGRAWLERIAARKDRQPETGPAVAQAQLQAIQAWGRGDEHGGERFSYLRSIRQPVLVINGHDDIMVPTVNSFLLQQNLPSAWLILYPDSGHGALFQFPLEVAEQARVFLA